MEKENLDNLFRESLDEFSPNPDPRVWERIQVSLDKNTRQRKRVIPLWWQLGGAAAALALLFYLLIPSEEIDAIPQTKSITDSPASISVTQEPADDPKENGTADQNDLVTGREKPDPQLQETVLPQRVSKNSRRAFGNVPNESTSEDRTRKDLFTSSGSALAAKDETKGMIPPSTEEDVPKTKLDALAAVKKDAENDVAGPNKIEDSQTAELAEAEQNEALNELLRGQEEALPEEDRSDGKWAIGPSIAPVYFNGLGDGSPIDQVFAANEKSGTFNMSYGLQVSYNINRRLQLRSGLHKVDFGYNTNDIVFSSSLQASSGAEFKNIDFSPTSKYLVVNSQKALPAKSDNGFRTEIAARNTSREGVMVQEFGYLEVPLELNYTLIDRTLGVHIISGFSSLFLVDNNVSLESNTGTTEVGQANNINDVNFSANFGLGVQYKVNEKIDLQVEPLLKYQLNTFSNTAGNFRPYSIGVYSGIRFKF